MESVQIKSNATVKKSRDSNIELCRIICMLMIIAHHLILHGGSLFAIEGWTTNRFVALACFPLGKLSFVCFIAISMYFLCDQTFKSKKFVKLWCEVLFYSILFSVVAFGYGMPMTDRNWYSIFLPMAGNSHGFAAAYLAFYILLPFLVKVNKSLKKNQLLYLVVILFYFEVGTQIIGAYTLYTQHFSSELLLFVFLFFLMSYLKHYPISILNNRLSMALVVTTTYAMVATTMYFYLSGFRGDNLLFLLQIFNDESSIAYILGGIALFYFFKNTHIHHSRYINTIAVSTFGVLLIHDHNFFRYTLWSKILKVQDWYYSDYYPVFLVLTIVLVFVVCILIDFVRRYTLEKAIEKSNYINSVCEKWDKFISTDYDG